MAKRWKHWKHYIWPLPDSIYDQFYKSRAGIQVLDGPYETGKTLTMAMKKHSFACKYPNLRIAVVRKVYADLVDSYVRTYEDKTLGFDPEPANKRFVKRYGGRNSPKRYHYSNGTTITLVGLDRNPGKVLGSEYDIIVITQCEELKGPLFERICNRATGRSGFLKDAKGIQVGYVFADCNPGPKFHFLQTKKKELDGVPLRELHKENKSDQLALEWFQTRHTDNVSIYDPINKIYTPYGRQALANFEKLSDLEYKRGVLGLWISAEGVVYPMYDPELHEVEMRRDEFGIETKWYMAIDYGGTSPFSVLIIAKKDNIYSLFKEIFITNVTIEELNNLITLLLERYKINKIQAMVADTNVPGFNKYFREQGYSLFEADKDILSGIDACKQVIGDNRLYVNTNSLEQRDSSYKGLQGFKEEILSYTYLEPEKQRTSAKPDHPMKENDHSMDAFRYLMKYMGEGGDLSELLSIKPSATINLGT